MKVMAHCEYCRKIRFFSTASKYRICPECLNILLSTEEHRIMNMRQDPNSISNDTAQKYEWDYDIKKYLF